MNNVLLLLIGCMFFGNIYSQQNQDSLTALSYFQEVNKAELFTVKSEYHHADSIYRNAFSAVKKPFSKDLIQAARNSTHITDTDSFIEYIARAFKQGVTLKQIKSDNELNVFIKQNKLSQTCKKVYKQNKALYKTNRDKNLRKKVNKLVRKDQWVRHPLIILIFSDKLMKKRDPKTFSELIELINEYGFPGFSKIGDKIHKPYGFADISLLMRHMSTTMLDSLKPHLINAIFEMELTPYNFASAYDYAAMFQEYYSGINKRGNFVSVKQFVYGTLFYQNVSTVRDIKTSDSLRKMIGLEPLSDFILKQEGKTINEGFHREEFNVNKRPVKLIENVLNYNIDSLMGNLDYFLVAQLKEKQLESNHFEENQKFDILFEIGLMHSFLGDYTKAKSYFNRCEILTTKSPNKTAELTIYNLFLNNTPPTACSMIFSDENELNSCLYYLEKRAIPFVEVYSEGEVLFRDVLGE